MSDLQIKSNLCYYDRENPNNFLEAFDEEDRIQPRNECYCDNCFSGRDKLAVQVLEMQRERDEARKEIAEVISCIEQAIVHNQFNSAFVIRNLLENINRRRKRNE